MTSSGRSTAENRIEGGGGDRVVAVVVDNTNRSRHALKWALDNKVVVAGGGQRLVLVHVVREPSSSAGYASSRPIETTDPSIMELFLPFRCYCARKQVKCEVVVLQNLDVAKALIAYVSNYAINMLILGGSSKKKKIGRLFKSDVTSNVIKGAPGFCDVYVICRGKVSSVRHATLPAPNASPAHKRLFAPLRLDDTDSVTSSAQDGSNTMFDELTVQDDRSSFSSSEESTDGDIFVINDEKASGLIHHAKNSECNHNVTGLSMATHDNYGPCSPNSSSFASDRRIRSVSSHLAQEGVDFKNKHMRSKLKEAIDIAGACKTTHMARLQEIEDGKKVLETNYSNGSGWLVRRRRGWSGSKVVEASNVSQKSAQNAALSVGKQADPGNEVADAMAKIYRILVYLAISNAMVVLFFAGWQIWN